MPFSVWELELRQASRPDSWREPFALKQAKPLCSFWPFSAWEWVLEARSDPYWLAQITELFIKPPGTRAATLRVKDPQTNDIWTVTSLEAVQN